MITSIFINKIDLNLIAITFKELKEPHALFTIKIQNIQYFTLHLFLKYQANRSSNKFFKLNLTLLKIKYN